MLTRITRDEGSTQGSYLGRDVNDLGQQQGGTRVVEGGSIRDCVFLLTNGSQHEVIPPGNRKLAKTNAQQEVLVWSWEAIQEPERVVSRRAWKLQQGAHDAVDAFSKDRQWVAMVWRMIWRSLRSMLDMAGPLTVAQELAQPEVHKSLDAPHHVIFVQSGHVR